MDSTWLNTHQMMRKRALLVLALLLAVTGCQIAALRDRTTPDDAPDTVYTPGILPLAPTPSIRLISRMDPTVIWPCHGRSGATVVSYTVNAKGEPADIHFVARDGSFLDDVARRILAKSRFRMSRDGAAQGAASNRYHLRITFVIQGQLKPYLPEVPFPEWVVIGNLRACKL